MDYILVVLLSVTLILVLLYVIPVKLKLLFYMDTDCFCFKVVWRKIFKMEAELKGIGMHISIYLLNLRIRSGQIIRGKSGLSMRKALSIDETYLKARYGLNTPYLTGLMLIPTSIIGMSNMDSFELIPDFFSNHEYIHVEGGTKLNIGKTIINILRLKEKSR